MNMKTISITLGSVCSLLAVLNCHAQDTSTPQATKSSFESLAPELNSQHPWDSGDLSLAQKQSVDQLGKLADKMMAQSGPTSAMLTMLNDYKTQDGYQRQKLIDTILHYPKYSVSDVPFLKSVLLASLAFHYDQYPNRVRGWHTPFSIQYHLADMILTLKGQGNLINNPDVKLIGTDPAAWLAKYAP